MKQSKRLFTILWVSLALIGCASPADPLPASGPAVPASNPGTELTDALIYAGPGTWSQEITELANVLYQHGSTYVQMGAQELEALSVEQLARFRLIIVPGGDAWVFTHSLTGSARARLRTAVRERGLSYLGFCAGAWIAVTPEATINDNSYGVGIVTGPIQEHSYLEKEGRQFALSRAQFPDGTQRELLWYGGPVTPKIPGGVVAKYADGTPAITQMRAGNGFVIISGLHPAISRETLLELNLLQLEAVAPEFAWRLIEAGLKRKELPAFP